MQEVHKGYVSKERVKDFAEVFTPDWVVNRMIDNVLDECGQDRIFGTWFEPSFGRGAFLKEILRRKLAAGMSEEDACKTIYGVEIQQDNYEITVKLLNDMCKSDMEEILRTNLVLGDFLHGADKIIFKDWKTGETQSLLDMIRSEMSWYPDTTDLVEMDRLVREHEKKANKNQMELF